jgi:hypothetical protein
MDKGTHALVLCNLEEERMNINRKSGRICEEAVIVSIQVPAQCEFDETGKGKRLNFLLAYLSTTPRRRTESKGIGPRSLNFCTRFGYQ